MKSDGFTLVELLAVIVIMGIVSVIGIPSLAGMINDNHRACDTYRDAIVTASKSFMLKEGKDIRENRSIPNPFRLYLKANLIDGGYIEAYNDSRTEIGYMSGSNLIRNDAYIDVLYDSSTKTYSYTVHMVCYKKGAGSFNDRKVKDYP